MSQQCRYPIAQHLLKPCVGRTRIADRVSSLSGLTTPYLTGEKVCPPGEIS